MATVGVKGLSCVTIEPAIESVSAQWCYQVTSYSSMSSSVSSRPTTDELLSQFDIVLHARPKSGHTRTCTAISTQHLSTDDTWQTHAGRSTATAFTESSVCDALHYNDRPLLSVNNIKRPRLLMLFDNEGQHAASAELYGTDTRLTSCTQSSMPLTRSMSCLSALDRCQDGVVSSCQHNVEHRQTSS